MICLIPKVMAGTTEGKCQEGTLKGTQLPLVGLAFISGVTSRPEGPHERGYRGALALGGARLFFTAQQWG